MIHENKYSGCFFGLAIGDAYGAPFEGGLVERLLWKIIGTTKKGKIRYTDDTQMSLDVAESFLTKQRIDQNHLSHVFSNSYQWSRGYGPSAGRVVKKIKKGAKWQEVNKAKFKDGSFGNGAAMRAPIIAMCFSDNMENIAENVKKCSEITHAHPRAIEGAELIALVTYSALNDWDTEKIVKSLPFWCTSNCFLKKVEFCIEKIKTSEPDNYTQIKKELGNGIAATESCVTAIYFALKFRYSSYDGMLEKIYSLGGDTDTIGAMAGAIWGAFHGENALPAEKVNNIESYSKIKEFSHLLYAHQMNHQSSE